MTSTFLGKLYTRLEHANISEEQKNALQKMLANLTSAEQMLLLNTISDKDLLDIFVKNVLDKLELGDGDGKKIIESEIAILQKVAVSN